MGGARLAVQGLIRHVHVSCPWQAGSHLMESLAGPHTTKRSRRTIEYRAMSSEGGENSLAARSCVSPALQSMARPMLHGACAPLWAHPGEFGLQLKDVDVQFPAPSHTPHPMRVHACAARSLHMPRNPAAMPIPPAPPPNARADDGHVAASVAKQHSSRRHPSILLGAASRKGRDVGGEFLRQHYHVRQPAEGEVLLAKVGGV